MSASQTNKESTLSIEPQYRCSERIVFKSFPVKLLYHKGTCLKSCDETKQFGRMYLCTQLLQLME